MKRMKERWLLIIWPLKALGWIFLLFALPFLGIGLLLDKFDEDIYFNKKPAPPKEPVKITTF